MQAAAAKPVFLEYKSPDGDRITHIRSTLISSSLQGIKALGFLEHYLEVLPPEHHESMLAPRAPCWIPEDEALVHYQACEAMRLQPAQRERLCQKVVRAVGAILLATFTRTINKEEGDPWSALEQSARMFSRVNKGGSIRVLREGPTEAVVEVFGGQLYSIPYYELGHRVLLRGSIGFFRDSAQARTLHIGKREHRLLLSWT